MTNMLAPYRVPLFNEIAGRQGLTLKVFLAARSEPGRQWDWPEDVHFDYQLGRVLVVRAPRGRIVYVAPQLVRALSRFRPSAVVAGGAALGIPALVGARLSHARFYSWSEATEVSEREETPPWRWRVKAVLARSADGCIAASSATAVYYRSLGVPAERVHVSILPIDVGRMVADVDSLRSDRDGLRARLKVGGVVLIYVGRLEPFKGVDLLLEAFLEARKTQAQLQLLLVGDGSLRETLALRSAAEAPEAVTFTGFVQPGDLARYYACADVFCLFSRREAFGAVVAEALAAGLPVVSSRAAGATADLVEEGCNGYAVDPSATRDCARVLAQMAGDADLRAHMGAASRERAHLCSVETAADTMLAAIRGERIVAVPASRSAERQ